MSFEELGRRFDDACICIGTCSDNKKRKDAEDFIQHCQNHPKPYDFCRHILEGKQYSEAAKFFAANTIKKAIVQEWSILDLNVKLQLNQYIFEFIASVVLGGSVPSVTGAGSIMPPSTWQKIVNQLLQSYAIIQKRSWIDEENGGRQFREMTYKHIQQLLTQDGSAVQKSQNLALQILLNLITEFSLGGHSSEIGMTWEFHEKSRISFQEDFLSNCFVLGIDVLKRGLSIQDELLFSAQKNSSNDDISELLKMSVNALQLIGAVLTWDFSPFNEMSSFKSIVSTKMYKNRYASSGGGAGSAFLDQVKLNPKTKEWKDRFVDISTLKLLINFHQKFRQASPNAIDSELFIRITHQVRSCLIQWCNISNECFDGDESLKLNFFIGLLSSIFSLMNAALSNVTSLEFSLICGQEIYDCTQCIFKLFTNFGFTSFIEIYHHLGQQQFFEVMHSFTQATIRTIEISSRYNDQSFVDSLTTLLECWGVICGSITMARHNPSGTSQLDTKGSDFVRQCSFEIFKGYLNMKVPDQRTNTDTDDEYEEENEELVVEEQLNSIGVLGRQLAEPSLQFLFHKFSSRFTQIQSLFGQNILHNRQLDILWEDFEWIIEIGGYILADNVEGESPTLPLEIVELTGSTDNIFFEFVNAITKFSQFELLCLTKSPQMLSPRIAKTVMWFFWRWGQSYLMPEVSHHTESISKSIIAMYGEKSENGLKMVDYLLQKISHNLVHWASEHDTCQETIKLFNVMATKKSIRGCVIQSNTFTEMVKNDFNSYHNLHRAPNWIKGKLTQCLIHCCPAFVKKEGDKKNYDTVRQVLSFIFNPLRDQFNSVLSRSDFQEIYQKPQTIEQLDYCIEKFLGIAKGSHHQDLASITLSYFESEQILQNLVKLMSQYHLHEQFITSIVRTFKNCVKSFVSYLSKAECASLFSIALSMIQTYQQFNIKKTSSGSTKDRRNVLDDLTEEERYKDLLLILKMLTCMISKEFLDFEDNDTSGVFSAEIRIKSNDLPQNDLTNFVFQGIHLILPLITVELLDFAPLRKQYFKLIGFMMEMYPEKVSVLPNQLFNHFINSLVFGMRHYDLEIAQDSFDAILGLSGHRSKVPNAFDQQDQSFVSMLIQECVNLLLYETFDIELLHNISDTLYGLILWDRNGYRMVVESILQQEQVYAQEIANGFQFLMNGIDETNPMMGRKNSVTFYSNLEKVIAKLRCFTRRK